MQQLPQNLQQQIELRIRTLRTLWIAMLFSVVCYYVFTLFVGQPKKPIPNNTLSIILLGFGVLTTLISIWIKNKSLARSVEQQRVAVLQQGHIVAWALCEVAALLGLLDFFATGNRFYYLGFVVAALGQLIHFPRRQDVVSAYFRNPPL